MPLVKLHYRLSVILFVQCFRNVRAQDTAPSSNICDEGEFPWAFNSLNQSACVIASYLGEVCTPGTPWPVTSLDSDANQVYTTSRDPTKCECSSVMFALLAACTACQNHSISQFQWNTYSKNCTSVSEASFPFNIPNITAVPHWAYQDVASSKNTFNLSIAEALGDTDTAESSGINSPPATSTALQTSTSTSTSPSTPSTNSSGTLTDTNQHHVAPVSGAVAGGVIAGCLLLFIGFCFIQRHLRKSRSGLSIRSGTHEMGDIDGSIHQSEISTDIDPFMTTHRQNIPDVNTALASDFSRGSGSHKTDGGGDSVSRDDIPQSIEDSPPSYREHDYNPFRD
ncbi:hypothetical protein SISSUDRAFT_1133532 [Sistotremastrum suecicum HHB10207 ss-3]|uniref:Mid2 domain-containing protein n=1 Tax=Sistotremastrum suecicum HHB10207 ss-3 TaxID=1314776 RepID=A0A165X007_9AGAM|nr:hypothetical protein SISSUDRAFT_1133532 [Sistotremastrum suecicum HHB10207 ss-3]